MVETIREQLLELAEEDYRKFSSRLLPDVDNMLGVRVPILRRIAKKLAKGDWRAYLAAADSDYFEEIMLQGMVIGYAKANVEEILSYAAAFVPKIDNWSVCDSFCTGLKITSKNKERFWDFLMPYLYSEKEFAVRFAVVMMLDYYIEGKYIDEVLKQLDSITHDGYYVKMAIAWAVSICFIKMPEPTLAYLKTNTLDDWTYNKALQKITESLVIDKDTKEIIRSMKRKRKF